MLIDDGHEENLLIMAFGAHPDDTDIGCSGTLALHAQLGHRVGVCDLTRAELSSNGTVTSRRAEAILAGRILGLTKRVGLSMPDRGLVVNDSTVTEVVEILRRFRPTYVFAPDYEDRHPDHRRCAEIVEEAVFTAALTQFDAPGHLPAHRVKQVLYYAINGMNTVHVAVDIQTVVDKKRQALAAYGSQFHMTESSVATPLNKTFLSAIDGRDALVGHLSGLQWAEGFRIKSPLTVPHLGVLVDKP